MGLLDDVLTDLSGVVDELAPDIFPDTMAVERATNTKSNQGGTVKTWAPVFSGIPCGPGTMRGRETVVAERRRNAQPVPIIAPARVNGVAVDVQAKDRLRIEATARKSEQVVYIDSIGRESGVSLEIVAFYEE